MARRPYHASILGALIALGAGCAQPPSPPPTWASRRAEGQLQRALAAEARGDLPTARDLAEVALDESRTAAHVAVEAQAMSLLGRLDGDPRLLLDAIDLLEALGETEALIGARLDLAAMAVDGGRLLLASSLIETALDLLDAAGLDRQAEARLGARAWHTYAAALRRAGAQAGALTRERQANLMLSLLDDTDLPRLRLEVNQRLGDDLAAAGDHRQAFQLHSRASFLARESQDRHAELVAITALSLDTEAMGRARDAVDHCERALTIALELDETTRAAALAHRALQLLMKLGETPASERWQRFSAVLERG